VRAARHLPAWRGSHRRRGGGADLARRPGSARLPGGGAQLSESFGLLKLAATALTAVSGIPGGIFSASLAVGAGLGVDVAPLFPTAPLGAFILLGMVSYFAGVVQAPITAFVIVTEMTDNHALTVPLMAAALIAYATSQLACREGIYHALAKNFLAAETARRS
jgi:H+/Cl- antiporter ClcA